MNTPASTEPELSRRSRFSMLGSVLGPFLALGLVTAFFGISDSLMNPGESSFLTLQNVRFITVQSATVAVAALGMTVIIIAGGIDLSAGTAVALSATVLAWSLLEDVALLVVHGDNVAGVTRRLDTAEKDLRKITGEIKSLPADSDKTTVEELIAKQSALQSEVGRGAEDLKAVQAASETWTPVTPWLAVLLAVGAGCLAGWVNGAAVSYLRVVPFIVTLGTMRVFLGVAKQIADETTVRPNLQTQVPDWLENFLSTRNHALFPDFGLASSPVDGGKGEQLETGGNFLINSLDYIRFPVGVWLALILALLLSLVLRYTVFGRYVFALGSSEATARLCGIDVRWNKIAVYMLGGLFIGIAGLYQFSRLSVGNPTSGLGLELNIIAAVVIGGGSLNGGRGSVLGTLTGALITQVITSGCTQLGLKNPVQDIILGTIIVAAVAVDQIRSRRAGS